MALLAKYYLTYSSPMGMDHELDSIKRRTHMDSSYWRPMLSPNGTVTSAPSSPHLSRRGTCRLGHRSSADYGDSMPKLDGEKVSPLVRRFSARRARAAASAPTSPRFGIEDAKYIVDSMESKLSTINSVDNGSRPMSPLCSDKDHAVHAAKHSPPVMNEMASRRRSRYASQKVQHQSYPGIASGYSFTSSTNSSPPSSAESAEKRRIVEDTEMRRRCSSGPLNEGAKSRKGRNASKKPEVLVTVSYSKNASFITATINKARNLPQASGAFVRVHLYDGFKPMSLKQTTIAQGGPDVEFKQAFMFSLGKDAFWATHILVELYEYDVIGNECKHGDVVIGPRASGSGLTHWRQMSTHPNIPCNMWHVLT